MTDSLNKGNHQIYHEKAIMLLFCLSLWLNKKIRTCGQSCKTLTHRNLQFVKIETSLYHASRVIIYYRKLFTRLATGLGTFLIPNVYITRYLCWKGSYEWFLSFLPCPVPPWCTTFVHQLTAYLSLNGLDTEIPDHKGQKILNGTKKTFFNINSENKHLALALLFFSPQVNVGFYLQK